jgi:hypothetical protein
MGLLWREWIYYRGCTSSALESCKARKCYRTETETASGFEESAPCELLKVFQFGGHDLRFHQHLIQVQQDIPNRGPRGLLGDFSGRQSRTLRDRRHADREFWFL